MSTLMLRDAANTSSAVHPGRWFVLVLPALAAIAYPLLLQAIAVLLGLIGVVSPPSPTAIAIVAIAILACAMSMMAVAFARALVLGRSGVGSPASRLLAHLAFAVPSLLVGFGNVVGLFHARTALAYAWPLFWLAVMALVTLAEESPEPALISPSWLSPSRRLAVAHGVSAVAILVLFVLPHLANHISGIISGADHIQMMKLLRLDYRNAIIEPLLLTLIAFQIMSGFVLVRRKLSHPSDFFGTLQTMTGVYVGFYLLGHMTAAFAARGAGTDTNWNWLTADDRGLLFYLSGFALVGHYWVGPIAIITHIGCGLRAVMLAHGVSEQAAARLVFGLIGLGVVVSSVILAGLLGAHIT